MILVSFNLTVMCLLVETILTIQVDFVRVEFGRTQILIW